MNTLLLFFALPIATIILAVVLQKILKCPCLVAATFFAIYLIITYAVFDSSFLVYVIGYTLLAFVSAVLTKWICQLKQQLCQRNTCGCNDTNITTISNGAWSCTARQTPVIALNNGNITRESEQGCAQQVSTNSGNTNDNPMIILTNGENSGHPRKNCGCSCGCRRR